MATPRTATEVRMLTEAAAKYWAANLLDPLQPLHNFDVIADNIQNYKQMPDWRHGRHPPRQVGKAHVKFRRPVVFEVHP